MALFLVQHGICLSKDRDPEKSLANAGVEQSRLIAGVGHQYQIPVKKIVHSGKKRAEQTALIFQQGLGLSEPVSPIEDISPMDDVTAFAKKIDPRENVMVIGHLPFMERLVSYLTTGNKDFLVLKFQNSGIVCLDIEDGSWFIKWTLNPDIS